MAHPLSKYRTLNKNEYPVFWTMHIFDKSRIEQKREEIKLDAGYKHDPAWWLYANLLT